MIQLIKAATLDYNQQLQKQAQETILKKRVEEPQLFFIENAQILSSINLPINMRQSAGTLISGALKIKKNNMFLWDYMSATNKASLKDLVLSTMIDRQKIIRRAAANIVAAICCIEIPRNEWNGIAQKITSNINNEDLIIKEVSILTIGFICEQLKQFDFVFDQPLQQTILTGILLGVKDNHNEIAQIAFKALRDGITSISAILSNNQYRDYLITQIAEAIRSNKFVQLGIQCLIEFVKNNFVYMNYNYTEGFVNLLQPYLKNPKQEMYCILAMEFWAVFAKQEKNIDSNPTSRKYVSGPLADRLVQKLLENLCYVQQEDDEENGISDAASSCLQAIFQGDSSQFQTMILNFTQNTIKNQNWKFRQASIKAFSLLLIGLPSQISQDLVNVSLIEFVQLLQDPKQYVRYSALKSFALISQETGIVIINHKHFIEILKQIIKHAHTNQNFMRNVCKIVDNLCSVSGSVVAFKAIVDQLISVFLQSCLEQQRTSGSINHCLCTIINLIKNSQDPVIAQKYIDYVLANFSKIEFLKSENREIFYSGFFTLAQVCLMTIRKYNGSLVVEDLSNLYDLVINYYKKINNVESDGYYVVSALSFFMQKDTRLVDDYWKFILFGFKQLNRADVFRATISCVCDFASIYHTAIANKITPLLEDIITQFDGLYKIDLLMLIGELFLNCAEVCWPYLKKVMNLLIITLNEILNQKDLNKAEIIQQSLVETFLCIYHGLSPNEQLIPYIQSIFTFVIMTTDKTRCPKLDYFQSALTLLADLTSFYPNQCRKYITNNPIIVQRVNTLVRYNTDGSISQIIKYIRQQFRI